MSPAFPEPKKRSMALVTGAARRLGRAIALGLAGAGYAVGLHYFHSESEALETAEEIRRMQVPVSLFCCDLNNEIQIEEMFRQVQTLPERLAVLVNSAAEMNPGDLQSMSVADWDAQLSLNLRAPWLCARAAARLMQPEGGVIINISDAGAGRAWTHYPVYTISKAGVEVLTRLLARSLAPAVRVNGIAPGLVIPAADFSEAEWKRLVELVPLKKPVEVSAVVDAVIFLVNNKSITGQMVVVDGGYQIK
jgi:NAD(P)-dependent dehydrogenase (short-subunit alcohol dehydrogenase family)